MHEPRPTDFSAIKNEVFGRWLEPLHGTPSRGKAAAIRETYRAFWHHTIFHPNVGQGTGKLSLIAWRI